MTKEEILKNHLIGYEYILGNLQSSVINAMKEYARIQIEKDRERVRQESKKYLFTTSNGLETIHKETPINLD